MHEEFQKNLMSSRRTDFALIPSPYISSKLTFIYHETTHSHILCIFWRIYSIIRIILWNAWTIPEEYSIIRIILWHAWRIPEEFEVGEKNWLCFNLTINWRSQRLRQEHLLTDLSIPRPLVPLVSTLELWFGNNPKNKIAMQPHACIQFCL